MVATLHSVALAPEPYLSACLEVLKHATIHARLIAYGGHSGGLAAEKSDCLADLMDAIHNLPDLLQHWEKCDERLLRLFLQEFDEKWQGHTSVRLLATYLRLVERGPDQRGNARSSDTKRSSRAEEQAETEDGGEFALVDDRPGKRKRIRVLPTDIGDAIIFCTRDRLTPIAGLYGRQPVMHGVQEVRAEHYAVGIPFHDYAGS